MSLWSRIRNVWRGDREKSLDISLLPWLDSLRADAVFGWRQLNKHKATSAAAVLSLGLAIGSCAAAFRLIDALLWRPLPVANADRLYVAGRFGVDPGGNRRLSESSEYPLFERMRAAVRDDAELLAISYADRIDLTWSSDEEMEKVARQHCSGRMFGIFGLRPAAGRLLSADDDRTPGAHPVAVISYDYWSRRFGRDANVIGRTARMGDRRYEVVGVAPRGFTGAEPGIFVDIFVPAAMHPGVLRPDWSWFRTFAVLKPEASADTVRAKLAPVLRGFDEERARVWTGQSRQFIDRFLDQKLVLEPAPSGSSGVQRNYRQALLVLGALVVLVLLIACANLANLMTAQAAARARELALRVSIGAGRGRLVQLVLLESLWVGAVAAAAGSLFAAWAAPFVVDRISRPGDPVRLDLSFDWRVAVFTSAVALAGTFLFTLAPALRAISVRPAAALRGGGDPRWRPRLMHALIAAQVAFCFVVHVAAGLFVTSFGRLSSRPTGFATERLLLLDVAARRGQPPVVWEQVADRLRSVSGVDDVSLCSWPLLDGNGWNGFIWVDRRPTEILANFLGVSPGWARIMGIPLIAGRDLRPGETYPGAAMVNETFVKQVFGGGNAVGRWFEKDAGDGVTRDRFQVIGVVPDTRYRSLREPAVPIAFVPLFQTDSKGAVRPRTAGTYVVRTRTSDPLALAAVLRREVGHARSELWTSNVRTPKQLIDQQTTRERLLAALAMFFAVVAMLLAGVGLYGVLNYSVQQRRREIGIRIAVGASALDIARRVITGALAMVGIGSVVGAGAGAGLARYVESLLYHVKATDAPVMAVPWLTLLAATMLAALPAVIRAARIDPAAMLRSE